MDSAAPQVLPGFFAVLLFAAPADAVDIVGQGLAALLNRLPTLTDFLKIDILHMLLPDP